jgi:hypothetical protein
MTIPALASAPPAPRPSAPGVPATLVHLKRLIAAGQIVLDDRTTVDHARLMDASNEIMRTPTGVSFYVAQQKRAGASRRWLVLDAAGVDHLVRNARLFRMTGAKLAELRRVFEDPGRYNAPGFRMPNGDNAVVVGGQVYSLTSWGEILRYGLMRTETPPPLPFRR